ncbi:MAG TPA: ribonuclease III [Anaerolineales bacterium]|nr:ribonuclease III [Anaerolineales bacterium]
MEFTQGDLGTETPQEFAQRIKLPIQDTRLLYRALTHRSYVNEHADALEDNERLEFLGDAVLDFLVGAWLYNHFPEMSEGELTRLRSALVRTEQLANFARQIDLGAALRLGRGEAENGGRQRPALLCAGFEAVVGALFLDGGLESVRIFIEPLLHPAAHMTLLEHQHDDPKSMLQEWAQSHGYSHPQYRTVAAHGPDHAKMFEVEVLVNGQVYGTGSGPSKQAAAKIAAHIALTVLDLL